MITTLCLNPSFDRTVAVQGFRLGETNRALTARVDAGGKGLNVALALTRLGVDAQCAGIAGADDVASLRAMTVQQGVAAEWMPVPGHVRVNTKLCDASTGEVTEINEPGPEVTDKDLDRYFGCIEPALRRSDYLVCTGSLPPGCPATLYADWMRRLKGVPCVLDASGPALAEGLTARPFLVKPNLEELTQLTGLTLESRHSLEAVAEAGRSLLRQGAERAIVSMGSDGALLVTAEGVWFAPALRVEVRSTVGAGDTMIAGFLAGYQATHSDETAMIWAVAAAAASVMREGTQPPERADFEALQSRVSLRRLE